LFSPEVESSKKIELAQQRGGSLLATKTGLKPTGMHCMRRSNVTKNDMNMSQQ
jgi:hypothetical protein